MNEFNMTCVCKNVTTLTNETAAQRERSTILQQKNDNQTTTRWILSLFIKEKKKLTMSYSTCRAGPLGASTPGGRALNTPPVSDWTDLQVSTLQSSNQQQLWNKQKQTSTVEFNPWITFLLPIVGITLIMLSHARVFYEKNKQFVFKIIL